MDAYQIFKNEIDNAWDEAFNAMSFIRSEYRFIAGLDIDDTSSVDCDFMEALRLVSRMRDNTLALLERDSESAVRKAGFYKRGLGMNPQADC